MAFELNEEGNIDSNPLVTFDYAVVADAICLMRLELARLGDPPERGSISVQLTMRADQASELAEALQKMVTLISKAAPAGRPH
jgi:hypothetical protein